MSRPLLVRSPRSSGLRAVFGETVFGYRSYATASLPDRVYSGLDAAERPPTVLLQEPALDVQVVPTPAEYLRSGRDELRDSWPQETRRTLARLEALWLLLEDHHRLLDAQEIEPLAHQASLVHHILQHAALRRVLIADEVGLGKTLEAGLLIKRLSEASPDRPLRVLYLTPARLVDNVADEFVRLGLRPRRWTSTMQEARLTPGDSDPLVIASIHRAVYRSDDGPNHFETVQSSGPWDVIIVDEAHHLTDYSSDGSDPKLRMRLVRHLVKERLNHDGRVILMTGTPHQGHAERFKNLLGLLDESRGRADGAQGRIIYRTKDDIVDWNGSPLFPVRDVRPPTEVNVGLEYRQWLRDIHALFADSVGSRMGVWRRAQALQWAASSPQAGLAYLVRMALRAGLSPARIPALPEAIEMLRPYRGGSPQESTESIIRRLEQDARSGDEDVDIGVDKTQLAELIATGTELVRSDAIAEKLGHVFSWLDEAPLEKFVIFAQPIETVYTLKARIEAHLGPGTVSLIVGDQKPAVRQDEIRRFREVERVRVLVSSRAGGEGINLQVSRRLIHFDIPWNPMEMEQRVGRVHRFGSLRTVIVETLVLADSREKRVLDRCRARLGQIVRDLDQDRFAYLYSRTLSLIPAEELALLMAGEDFGPLTADEADRLDRLVKAGYEQWEAADQTFRAQSERFRTLERGGVRDEDLEELLVGGLGASIDPGWRRRGLAQVDGSDEPVMTETDARVLRLQDGTRGFVGASTAIGVVHPTVQVRPRRLGLNDPAVAPQLRARIGEGGRTELVRGPGVTMIPRTAWQAWLQSSSVTGLEDAAVMLAFVRRRIDAGTSTFRETSAELLIYCASATAGVVQLLDSTQGSALVRLLRRPRPKRVLPPQLDASALVALERRLAEELGVVAPGEPAVAVFPVAAVWIEPTDE